MNNFVIAFDSDIRVRFQLKTIFYCVKIAWKKTEKSPKVSGNGPFKTDKIK